MAFTEVNIAQTPATLGHVAEELGCSQAPTVVVDDDLHWSGLDPVNVNQAINKAREKMAE